jgi:NitT/TauT family transport system ATP-binding protein
MLFQHPSLFPWLTIRQNIMFGPKAQKRPRPEAASQAESLLQKVGLGAFGEAYPRELSGGMKHRAAFARALINEPAVLLLDEPFAALDAITRASMQRLLLEIWAEQKMSIVFVTHDVGEAALLGDRVVLMSPGPGRIHQIVTNTVPRPERLDVDSLASAELRRALRGELAQIMAADPGRAGHA